MASGFGLQNTHARNFKHLEFIPFTHITSVIQFKDTRGGLGQREGKIPSYCLEEGEHMHFELSSAKESTHWKHHVW